MKAPYSLPDDTEYGCQYVLVEEGKQPRTVTVWNGVERSFTESMVHDMRKRTHHGVRYLCPRLLVRPFPAGTEVMRMKREHANYAMKTPVGAALLLQERPTYAGLPSELTQPRSFWRPSRAERYIKEHGLEDWMLYGTQTGDDFLQKYWEDRLELYGLTLTPPPKRKPKQKALI